MKLTTILILKILPGYSYAIRYFVLISLLLTLMILFVQPVLVVLITSSLPQGIRYMAAADCGYDDHKLYDLSITRGFELVCPVSEIYNHTPSKRLQLIEFYESKLGQVIYSWRGISVEPLIQHIKDIFKIDP